MKPLYCFIILFTLILPLAGNSQNATISGNITNQKNDKLLDSVSIYESNSRIGTISDKNGFYKLMLKPGLIEIEVTYDGFKNYKRKLVLLGDTTLNVQLVPLINLKSKNESEEQNSLSENIENRNRSNRKFK